MGDDMTPQTALNQRIRQPGPSLTAQPQTPPIHGVFAGTLATSARSSRAVTGPARAGRVRQ